MTGSTERFHALSHFVLFLMLFAITLAVMKFSTPTGFATGNYTIGTDRIGDLKPFLTAVGLLMGLFVAAVAVFGMKRLEKAPQPAQHPEEGKSPKLKPAEADPEKSIAEINRDLARIRRMLR